MMRAEKHTLLDPRLSKRIYYTPNYFQFDAYNVSEIPADVYVKWHVSLYL